MEAGKHQRLTPTPLLPRTVRAASIRLFYLYCVEIGYDIRQYDVPQAFLQSPMDDLIFVRPPQGYASYPGGDFASSAGSIWC